MKNYKDFNLLFILVLISCLSGFASDIYTPSFLAITGDFNTALKNVQSSMSIFMLALSITQLIYGPMSEVTGRRLPLLMGLFVMSIGSIVCIYAINIELFLIGRFIQGAGAGACACLWRSIFRDAFSGIQIAKYGGYLGIIMVFIVAASPFLGGYLDEYFGWRASFVLVVLYSSILLILTYFRLPETNIHHHKDRLSIKFYKSAFTQLLTSHIFMGYALCVFFTYGAFFSWFVVGPVLLIEHINLSPTNFGTLNLILGGTAMATAGIFNGKMIVRLGHHTMLRLGWSLAISSGIIMLSLNLLYGDMLLFPILVGVFIFLFGITLIWPNAFSGAFSSFGSIAGYAGALYSCIQLGGGAVFGWMSSFFPGDNPYTLPLIFIFMPLVAWLIFEFIVRKGVQKINK